MTFVCEITLMGRLDQVIVYVEQRGGDRYGAGTSSLCRSYYEAQYAHYTSSDALHGYGVNGSAFLA